MQPSQIAELLEPYLGKANDQRLTANDLDRISTYIDLLNRWNARINLTAIRNEEEIVTRHFGESLFAARHLFPDREVFAAPSQPAVIPNRREAAVRNLLSNAPSQSSTDNKTPEPSTQQAEAGSRKPKAADLGSGAGFPGIPIKLWAPDLDITLIESNHKKAAFLREAARVLTLMNINILTVRAETLPAGQFDLVTLRAVERFDQILPTAAALLAPGGRLALLIGSAQIPQAQAIAPNLSWTAPIPIPQSQSRVLLEGQNHSQQDSRK